MWSGTKQEKGCQWGHRVSSSVKEDVCNQTSKAMAIPPIIVKLFHSDQQTDHYKKSVVWFTGFTRTNPCEPSSPVCLFTRPVCVIHTESVLHACSRTGLSSGSVKQLNKYWMVLWLASSGISNGQIKCNTYTLMCILYPSTKLNIKSKWIKNAGNYYSTFCK